MHSGRKLTVRPVVRRSTVRLLMTIYSTRVDALIGNLWRASNKRNVLRRSYKRLLQIISLQIAPPNDVFSNFSL